jgi:thiamine pyrophosphokinase
VNLQRRTTSGTPSGTVVISNGCRPIPHTVIDLVTHDHYRVVVADGGLRRCLEAGLEPDLLIGDLDSAPVELVAAFLERGGEVRRFPANKDATDLELALQAAEGNGDLVIVGGDGEDRFDHLIGELWHVASVAHLWSTTTMHYPPAVIHVLVAREQGAGAAVSVSGEPGSVVSLMAVSATVEGVTTTGLRWPLQVETLRWGSTRGVSNELVHSTATVTVSEGSLLIVQPVVTGDPPAPATTSLTSATSLTAPTSPTSSPGTNS